jgi:hypothetical protein
MTNRKFVVAALAIALIPAACTFAQVPPPPPPGVAPPPAYGNATAPIVTGRITKFLINPNGDVDGLLLGDGTQVNFPPHLSAALTHGQRTGLSWLQQRRGACHGHHQHHHAPEHGRSTAVA